MESLASDRSTPLVWLLLLFLGVAGCRADAPSHDPDPLVGDWELEKVNGLGSCMIQSGDLSIQENEDRELVGEFEWVGNCTTGGAIDDFAEVVDVVVDEPGSLYQIDLMAESPDAAVREFDCVLDDPDLDCDELAGDIVVQFQFVRRT